MLKQFIIGKWRLLQQVAEGNLLFDSANKTRHFPTVSSQLVATVYVTCGYEDTVYSQLRFSSDTMFSISCANLLDL